MKKRLLSTLLALCMALTLLPETAWAAWGICGYNLTWTLDHGTLTIEGTGSMTDYSSYESIPWYYIHYGQIDALIIVDGVTSIGQMAFTDCYHLTSVTFPGSVTSIGIGAFWNWGLSQILCKHIRGCKIERKFYKAAAGLATAPFQQDNAVGDGCQGRRLWPPFIAAPQRRRADP